MPDGGAVAGGGPVRRGATFACGVAGAALLVPTPVGIGAGIVALIVTGVLAAAGRRITPLAVVPIALAFVGSVRAAEWVSLPALGAAAALGSYQLSGSVPRAAAFVPGALRSLVSPPARGWPGGGSAIRYVRGLAMGSILLAVFGFLFVTADRAFAALASDLTLDFEIDSFLLRFTAFTAAAGVGGALVLVEPRSELGERPRRVVAFPEWGVALGLLVTLFATFCVVQITVLFGGHDAVLDTAGLTYAEYAREGFFQLLAAAALTLALVAAAGRWAQREGRKQELILRALLGALCVLTLIILASALRRLGLYEDAFGFTRLRVSAHALMLWLAVVFIGVVVAGAARRTYLLPAALTWLSAASVLAFAAADPDALIARRNVERYRATGSIDVVYLAGLSADAVPALLKLPPEVRACVLGPITEGLDSGDPIVAHNLSRARARRALANLDPLRCGPPATSAVAEWPDLDVPASSRDSSP